MESDKFRLRDRDIGLTYSRCEASKEEVRQHLLHLLPKASYICVSAEKHKDGAGHLHVQVQLPYRPDILNARFFDYGCDHPNVIRVQDSLNWNNYIKKDTDYVEVGKWEQIKILSKKKAKIDNKRLLEGNLQEMIDNNEISLFSLPGLLNARKAYQEISKSTNPDLPKFLPSPWMGLSLPVHPITEKQRHYWINSSQPNKGKTTFLKSLDSAYRASYYACSEKFQDLKADSQLLLFDEFGKGNSVKITELNQMCDGTFKYPRKGKPAVVLQDPYLVICSNFSISDVYPNSNGRVEARFKEITLDYYEFKKR